MEWLNYHHLLYFWAVAKEGSVTRACAKLRLSQPAISGQIRTLEENLGEKLFQRSGRRLMLTEVGQVAFRYADEIFTLGGELREVLRGQPSARPLRLRAGISDLMPKLIAYRILEPAMKMDVPVELVCMEDRTERLLGALASHELDLILADSPLASAGAANAFHHLLGSCPISLFGAPRLVRRYRKKLPGSLRGAPFLLPVEGSTVRRSLDQWFDAMEIRPRVVGQFQDSAMMKAFGQSGSGFFPAPAAIRAEICRQYGVSVLMTLDEVREDFYAITVERRLRHAAVLAISEAARDRLFPLRPARRNKEKGS